MKKSWLLTGLLLFMVTALFAQSLPADKIVGVWYSEANEMKIEIFKSGNTYSSKLVAAKIMFEADGTTSKKDVKNPDPNLRNRPIQGLVHITDLVYKDGKYVDGALYSPETGDTYTLKGELKGPDKLETRGYKGSPILGRTFKWIRVK